jgi:hypothetical protein
MRCGLAKRFVLLINVPSHTHRLEGIRFLVLQFYPMARRRLPGMTQRNAFTRQFYCEAMHALR